MFSCLEGIPLSAHFASLTVLLIYLLFLCIQYISCVSVLREWSYDEDVLWGPGAQSAWSPEPGVLVSGLHDGQMGHNGPSMQMGQNGCGCTGE